MVMRHDNEPLFASLLEACHVMSLEDLPDQLRQSAELAGMHGLRIYVADLQEDVLRLLTGRGADAGESSGESLTELCIDATAAGRAFQSVQPVRDADEGGDCWWVPLRDGAERVGVLRVDRDGSGEQASPVLRQLAALVTMIILSKRSSSDAYARRVRTRPMNVAAEMQWNLMPPRAFANDRVAISATLEPAYEIGGDAFDYALSGDTVHLGIFDATGHDVPAGLTANLAVAACRNHRRQGTELAGIGKGIESTLLEELHPDRYVTALLADLDIRTGRLSWISHGRHPPVIIRDGSWDTPTAHTPGHPLGSDLGVEAHLSQEQLQPGDRVVLYTDGITETHSPGGEEFGLDRFMSFLIGHNAEGMPVPETLRRLVHTSLDYHHGGLQDDATVLFLEWRGPRARFDGSETPAELISHPD